MRRISARGLALINRRESCVLKPYHSREQGPDEWTIAWGHLMHEGEQIPGIRWIGTTPSGYITQATADDLRRRDVAWAEAEVERLVHVPLSQNQFDALCSFVYNGLGGWLRNGTIGRELNAGNYVAAAQAFTLYHKRKDPKTHLLVPDADLMSRRKEEAALFVLDDEALTCGLPENDDGEPEPPAAA